MRYIVDDHLSMLPLKLMAVTVWAVMALLVGFWVRSEPVVAQDSTAADVTGDGIVDFSDFSLLVSVYGSSAGDGVYVEAYDIAPLATEGGPDGVINAYDMNQLATYYERL